MAIGVTIVWSALTAHTQANQTPNAGTPSAPSVAARPSAEHRTIATAARPITVTAPKRWMRRLLISRVIAMPTPDRPNHQAN